MEELRNILPDAMLRRLDDAVNPLTDADPLGVGRQVGWEAMWLYPQYGNIVIARPAALRRAQRAARENPNLALPHINVVRLLNAGRFRARECGSWVILTPIFESQPRPALRSNWRHQCVRHEEL